MQANFVIKVGGSLLNPDYERGFDFEFAHKLLELLKPAINDEKKLGLIAGGGQLARRTQQALKEHAYSDYDRHYVGTMSCNVNAAMLRAVFHEYANEEVLVLNELRKENTLDFIKPVQVCGGGPVGPSSDWDATHIAKRMNAKIVLSLKNVDGLYTADPRHDTEAKKIDACSWAEYLEIIGNPNLHEPSGSFPVDVVAARYAMQNEIKFYILDGKDLENVEHAMMGREFIGSIIG